jgi:hypothetical protein
MRVCVCVNDVLKFTNEQLHLQFAVDVYIIIQVT